LNYEATWELMSNLIAELRKSGEAIPVKVMRDLRAAKTMMEVYKVDRSRSENLLRIEEYLANLESYLVPEAKKKLGEEYINKWLNNLAETQRRIPAWKSKPPKGFPVGVPRDSKWVRIEPSDKIPIEKIKRLTKQNGLKSEIQADGYALVFGEEQKLKQFVKKMAEILRETPKNVEIH
jgi:hypothetical protein